MNSYQLGEVAAIIGHRFHPNDRSGGYTPVISFVRDGKNKSIELSDYFENLSGKAKCDEAAIAFLSHLGFEEVDLEAELAAIGNNVIFVGKYNDNVFDRA